MENYEINLEPNTFTLACDCPKVKSCLKVGDITIYNTKRFNWLQRRMWKIFFGFDIENVED